MGEGDAGLGLEARALRVRVVDPRAQALASQLLTRDWVPDQPVDLERDEGIEAMDYVGATITGCVLISDRFRILLEENGFTGWATYPVQTNAAEVGNATDYHGLAITGRAGPIDDSLSQPVVIPPPAPGGRRGNGLRGICFQPSSWDGSDLFCCNGYAGVNVTERVRAAVVTAGLSNVEFRCLSEIERRWRSDGTVITSD